MCFWNLFYKDENQFQRYFHGFNEEYYIPYTGYILSSINIFIVFIFHFRPIHGCVMHSSKRHYELVSLVSTVQRIYFVNEKFEPVNSENLKRVFQKDTKYGTEVLEVYNMILRNIFQYISKLSKCREFPHPPGWRLQLQLYPRLLP